MRPYISISVFGIVFGLLFQIKFMAQQIDFHCTKVDSVGNITLLWQSTGLPSNYQYEVYASTSKTGNYTSIGTITNLLTTTYTHVPANKNIQWFYVIKASPQPPATGTEYTSDTIGSIFFVLNNLGTEIAMLYWTHPHEPPLASFAKEFVINQQRNGVWNEWKTTDALQYADTIHVCGEVLEYEIRLYDSSGCENVSIIRTDFFVDFMTPSIPQLDSVSINPLTGKTELGWEAVPETDVVGYIIYIFDKGIWKLVDTVMGAKSTHYIDTNTENNANNTVQQYRIAAIDTCRNASPMGKVHNTMLLNTSVDRCDSIVVLSWNPDTGMTDNVTGYRIWVSVDGINYVLIDSVLSDKLSYTHRGVNPISSYIYFVQAYNTNNGYSASSSTKEAIFNRIEGSGKVVLRYVSVVDNSAVEILAFIPDTGNYRNIILLKCDEDKTIFSSIETQARINGLEHYSFRDNNVDVHQNTYFYTIALTDECDHIFVYSDTGNNIVLQAGNAINDETAIQWKPYYGFKNRLDSYDIFRKTQISTFFSVGNVPVSQLSYSENVWSVANEGNKFYYQVSANENNTNIYGFQDKSYSNSVEIVKEPTTYIPNTFYPNSQIEENRVFKPVNSYVDAEEYVFSIYDRWGSLVFITNDINMGWDGSTNGKYAIAGIYTYIITYRLDEKTMFKKQGHVTLVR
ncbi:MAG: gliding motility-associated C-terminal domain-containing protein [Bacteroidales bacterium]|jgi:gliding motility-associated-like protein|nr:gliding motility-associated C-terminal domain-containing protein [Bacteroidales bacterium]